MRICRMCDHHIHFPKTDRVPASAWDKKKNKSKHHCDCPHKIPLSKNHQQRWSPQSQQFFPSAEASNDCGKSTSCASAWVEEFNPLQSEMWKFCRRWFFLSRRLLGLEKTMHFYRSVLIFSVSHVHKYEENIVEKNRIRKSREVDNK